MCMNNFLPSGRFVCITTFYNIVFIFILYYDIRDWTFIFNDKKQFNISHTIYALGDAFIYRFYRRPKKSPENIIRIYTISYICIIYKWFKLQIYILISYRVGVFKLLKEKNKVKIDDKIWKWGIWNWKLCTTVQACSLYFIHQKITQLSKRSLGSYLNLIRWYKLFWEVENSLSSSNRLNIWF